MYRALLALVLAAGCGDLDAPGPQPAVTDSDPGATPDDEPGVLPVPDMGICTSPTQQSITVDLGQTEAMLGNLFPVRGNLPWPYGASGGESRVPDTLDGSLELFVTSSLQGDGFTAITVTADAAGGTVGITATGCFLDSYQTQLPAFLAAGVVGWNAWQACLQDGSPCHGMTVMHACADKPSKQCIPWAFYLPLGQPLANHWGVMLLDYPPGDALCAADYQNNFTMARWTQVLAWGVSDPIAYKGIVDVHPIAAYGSDESSAIKKTGPFFKAYREQMLGVVTDPPNLAQRTHDNYGTGYGLPVMTAGSPSHEAWGEIVGQTVETGDTGKTQSLIPGKTTAWVASNHPDVTTYNCCPGDHVEACCDGTYTPPDQCTGGYGWSDELEQDEESDFFQACMFENTAFYPTMPFEAFALTCARGIMWGASVLCIQGRQDYQFSSGGHCNCKAAAELYCAANADALCPAQGASSCDPYNQQAGCPSSTNSYFKCAFE